MSQVLTHLTCLQFVYSLYVLYCLVTLLSLHDSNMHITGPTQSVNVASPAAAEEVVNDTTTVTAANHIDPNFFFAGTIIVLVGPVWPRGQKKQKSANSYLLFINYDRTTFSIGMDRNIAFVFYKLSCPAPPIIFRASFKTHIYTPSYSQSLSLLPNDLLNRYGSEESSKVTMSSNIK